MSDDRSNKAARIFINPDAIPDEVISRVEKRMAEAGFWINIKQFYRDTPFERDAILEGMIAYHMSHNDDTTPPNLSELVEPFNSGKFQALNQPPTKTNIFSIQSRIYSPPGWKLYAVAKFVFRKGVFEEVFEPILADMQCEYQEALAENQLWKARWRWTQYCLSFWKAMLIVPLLQLVNGIKRITGG